MGGERGSEPCNNFLTENIDRIADSTTKARYCLGMVFPLRPNVDEFRRPRRQNLLILLKNREFPRKFEKNGSFLGVR